MDNLRLKWQFVHGEVDIEDDAINIVEHPLDLHIQLTPYDTRHPFSVNYWTTTRKEAMRFNSCSSINEVIAKITNIMAKETI